MAQSTTAPHRTSIAVIGLGSIGGAVAGCLAETGRYDLVACVRRPLARLTVERPEGTVEVPLRALTDPQLASVGLNELKAKEKKIPYRTVGTHRRLMVSGILAYKDRESAYRRRIADELAEEAQKHGLGY